MHILEHKRLKGRGTKTIKIIVHYPETAEKQAKLDLRVAQFHADYVVQYIDKLDCSTDQKLRLIDSIADNILKLCKEEIKISDGEE